MVAIPAMRELPPRTYASDGPWRQRWTVRESIAHPAKMNAGLCRDLFLRYTRPGMTVLDPFLGIGTTLLGVQLGCNVVGVELEPKFAALARQNAERIRGGLLAGETGWALVLQGDSRRLPLKTADVCLSSPPYADSAHDPGNLDAMREKLEELYPGHVGPNTIRNATGYGRTPGQIGALRPGDVDAVLSSPPYGDVASRDRSEEPYSQAMDPELKRRFGTGDANRHIDGYGETPGNIGNIPYYDDTLDTKRSPKAPEGAETYASACLAVYRECHRVVRPGGVLVLVTGNYVRDGRVIDLAADTVRLCVAAGWTPVERFAHLKSNVSFWRRLHHQQGRPVVTHEDVLVFVKGYQGWDFAELAPTTLAPAVLSAERARPDAGQLGLFDEEVAGG